MSNAHSSLYRISLKASFEAASCAFCSMPDTYSSIDELICSTIVLLIWVAVFFHVWHTWFVHLALYLSWCDISADLESHTTRGCFANFSLGSRTNGSLNETPPIVAFILLLTPQARDFTEREDAATICWIKQAASPPTLIFLLELIFLLLAPLQLHREIHREHTQQ